MTANNPAADVPESSVNLFLSSGALSSRLAAFCCHTVTPTGPSWYALLYFNVHSKNESRDQQNKE